MQIRAEQHEVGARPANFRASEQRGDVLRLRVLATLLQTVGDCLQTDAVTVQAFVDALLHFVRDS